jgi:hypothetical protein
MWAPLETHFRGPFTARSVWSSSAGDEYEHLKDHGIILCTVDSVPFQGFAINVSQVRLCGCAGMITSVRTLCEEAATREKAQSF